MNVFVPYTEIQPATLEALKPYEFTPVRMVTDYDYLNYFHTRWEHGECFVNCEHDTVFHAGAIEELENCNYEWCAFGISESDNFVEGTVVSLAMMRFKARFIKKCPDLWEKMYTTDIGYWGLPSWKWCDVWLQRYTRKKGIICHQHYPPVVNANPNPIVEHIRSNESM
jgi:hypothetical protein